MTSFQIQRDGRGIVLYDRESAEEALLDYFADQRRGEVRCQVETTDAGEATVTIDGVTFTAREHRGYAAAV